MEAGIGAATARVANSEVTVAGQRTTMTGQWAW
jgi:hypothetical protein